MTTQAYLCPHCSARNRFDPATAVDGVVRCGACHQTFMLPDAAPPPRSPSSGGFEPRETAIVDARLAPAANPTGKNRPAYVAGSAIPTLLVHDSQLPRLGSNYPTLMVHDSRPVATDSVKPAGEDTPRPPVAEIDTAPDASARPEAVPRTQRPTILDAPLSAELAAAMSSTSVTVSPAALETSTAATQPTTAPADYRKPKVPEMLSRPDSGARPLPTMQADLQRTQPEVVAPRKVPVVLLGLLVVLGCMAIVGLLFAADARTSGRYESEALEEAFDSGTARMGVTVRGISAAMTAMRPDLVHRQLGQSKDLVVVRRDGTVAFNRADMGTYVSVANRVCESDKASPLRRWLRGDPRVAKLGPDPCKPTAAPNVSQKADLPARWEERTESAAKGSVVSWVVEEGDAREQILVQPITGGPKCAGCHKLPAEGPMAYAVLKTELSGLDAVLADNARTVLFASVMACLMLIVLLLAAARLAARPPADPI